jgi:hypothetical protein
VFLKAGIIAITVKHMRNGHKAKHFFYNKCNRVVSAVLEVYQIIGRCIGKNIGDDLKVIKRTGSEAQIIFRGLINYFIQKFCK